MTSVYQEFRLLYGCSCVYSAPMIIITCVYDRLSPPNAAHCLTHTFPVSCRTTSTWTRRRTSWWRTSWLTTKGCRTRRAMATASNWIRRLWLWRASRAAANPQSLHLLRSMANFDLVAPPEAPQPSTAVLRGIGMFSQGVVKPPDSSPIKRSHDPIAFEPLLCKPEEKLYFIPALAHRLSHTSNECIYCCYN